MLRRPDVAASSLGSAATRLAVILLDRRQADVFGPIAQQQPRQDQHDAERPRPAPKTPPARTARRRGLAARIVRYRRSAPSAHPAKRQRDRAPRPCSACTTSRSRGRARAARTTSSSSFDVLLQPVDWATPCSTANATKRGQASSRSPNATAASDAQRHARQQNPPRSEAIAQRTEHKLAQHVDGQIGRVDRRRSRSRSSATRRVRAASATLATLNDCRVR